MQLAIESSVPWRQDCFRARVEVSKRCLAIYVIQSVREVTRQAQRRRRRIAKQAVRFLSPEVRRLYSGDFPTGARQCASVRRATRLGASQQEPAYVLHRFIDALVPSLLFLMLFLRSHACYILPH